MIRDADRIELTDLIHAAATDPTRWPGALDRLGRALEAPCLALLVQDLRRPSGAIAASRGFQPELQRAYGEYYAERNVWMLRCPHLQVPGRVRLAEESCPEADLIKTEFYNDYMRPLGVHHGVGGTILQDGSLVANLSALRGKRAGSFGDEALRLMSALMPHLRGAIETHRRLAAARQEEQAILGVLDRLAIGVMLLDCHANPLFVNVEARRILAARDGLSLDHGSLRAVRARETLALQALVRSAALPGGGGGHLALGRPSLRRPLGVDVVPLVLPAQDGLPPRVIAVFVIEPDREPEPDEQVISRLYGLTAAEAALATCLVTGNTLEDAAAHRCITRDTARTHLKHILSKTGTHRQSELLLCLLHGPAGIVARRGGPGSHETP